MASQDDMARNPPPPNWWHFSEELPRRMVRTLGFDPRTGRAIAGETLATIEDYQTPKGRTQYRVTIPGCEPHRARSFRAAWQSVLAHFEYVEPPSRRQTRAITFENAPLRFAPSTRSGKSRVFHCIPDPLPRRYR